MNQNINVILFASLGSFLLIIFCSHFCRYSSLEFIWFIFYFPFCTQIKMALHRTSRTALLITSMVLMASSINVFGPPYASQDNNDLPTTTAPPPQSCQDRYPCCAAGAPGAAGPNGMNGMHGLPGTYGRLFYKMFSMLFSLSI